MRFMFIVKAGAEAGPGRASALMARMAGYREELARAGVLLDGSGLEPLSEGWSICCGKAGASSRAIGAQPAEAGQTLAGYFLLQVRSREEALEWSRRFPDPAARELDAEIEVRQLHGLEDPGSWGPSDAFET